MRKEVVIESFQFMKGLAPDHHGGGLQLEPAVVEIGERQDALDLELVEPALWLDVAPHGEEAFARAIVGAAERLAKQPLA